MVRLATIQHLGKRKLSAQLPENGYCDLSSIAPNARVFLERGEDAVSNAANLIASCRSSERKGFIPSEECSLLAPIDGSLVGKTVRGWFRDDIRCAFSVNHSTLYCSLSIKSNPSCQRQASYFVLV